MFLFMSALQISAFFTAIYTLQKSIKKEDTDNDIKKRAMRIAVDYAITTPFNLMVYSIDDQAYRKYKIDPKNDTMELSGDIVQEKLDPQTFFDVKKQNWTRLQSGQQPVIDATRPLITFKNDITIINLGQLRYDSVDGLVIKRSDIFPENPVEGDCADFTISRYRHMMKLGELTSPDYRVSQNIYFMYQSGKWVLRECPPGFEISRPNPKHFSCVGVKSDPVKLDVDITSVLAPEPDIKEHPVLYGYNTYNAIMGTFVVHIDGSGKSIYKQRSTLNSPLVPIIKEDKSYLDHGVRKDEDKRFVIHNGSLYYIADIYQGFIDRHDNLTKTEIIKDSKAYPPAKIHKIDLGSGRVSLVTMIGRILMDIVLFNEDFELEFPSSTPPTLEYCRGDFGFYGALHYYKETFKDDDMDNVVYIGTCQIYNGLPCYKI